MLIKVLGIGSPFGDDQVAWKIIDLLQKNQKLQGKIAHKLAIEKYDRPGLQLLDLMQGARTVFLIDAIKTNAAVGTIHRLENQEIEGMNNLLSSHSIGIAEALHLGRILNNLPENIIFYGIEISDIALDFEITPAINHAIIKTAKQLAQELATNN